VECIERGLDPLDTCLVVADKRRTEKTICLAVSPALKTFGLGGRPRLFEVSARIREVNRNRGRIGKSTSGAVLKVRPDYAVDYIVAPPRMSMYLEYSSRIYQIYLRYIAPEDIHVYSIDEVFIDVTSYKNIYKLSTHDLAMKIIREVLAETGITATAGIGTNMYLCKVAMDIMAKKMPPDKDGVRIAELDEMSYRHQLWEHTPLTDFWRVGRGIARRLAPYGIYTMGDIARFSLSHEGLLYKLFGVNAELLIDHAWGWEPVTMDLVKSYRPENRSVSTGQVLTCAYKVDKAKIVVLEMADAMALELFDMGMASDLYVLEVGYDVTSLDKPDIRAKYDGRITTDHYGRQVPFHAHGTVNIDQPTSLSRVLMDEIGALYDRIINPNLLIRRITLTACRLKNEAEMRQQRQPLQLDLFTDYDEVRRQTEADKEALEKERHRQEAILKIKKMYGKNAILRGLNYVDGATQRDRNKQIGGHHE